MTSTNHLISPNICLAEKLSESLLELTPYFPSIVNHESILTNLQLEKKAKLFPLKSLKYDMQNFQFQPCIHDNPCSIS